MQAVGRIVVLALGELQVRHLDRRLRGVCIQRRRLMVGGNGLIGLALGLVELTEVEVGARLGRSANGFLVSPILTYICILV